MAFNAEGFQLPIQNTLETARFTVEKVIDTFLAQDNKIYYKIKWQETWEPEERMMGICAPLINDFWKEYYQRTQQSSLQQQQSSLESNQNEPKQLQLPQSSRIVQQQNANQITTQQTAPLNHQSSLQQQPASISHQESATINHIPEDVSAPQQHSQVPTLQQTFQSVSQILAPSNSATGLDPSLLSSQPVSALLNQTSTISSSNLQSLQVEYRIQDGTVTEKKTPQLLLQSRFLTPNHMLKPCVPFLPAFSTLQQSIQEESVSRNSSSKFPKSFVCSICSKEFSNRHLLKRHTALHEPPTVHTCPTCSKSFSKKTALRRHELSHTSNRPHVCLDCGKGFKERSNLTKHMIIHSGERPHSCDVCDASFRQLGHLLKHILVHKPDKPFKCSSCDKAFKRKEHLKDHMIIHSGDFPFECEFCEKKFRFKTNLKVHVLQHDGRRDYVCDVCNKAFTGKANLTQHSLVHEPSYKFNCEICIKTFRRKGHLKRHLEVHRGDALLTCVFCKESFPDRSSYKKHLLTHTGSKPFACAVCEKRFGGKSYLQQHMLSHTDDGGTFECEHCNKKYHSLEVLEKHKHQIQNPNQSSCQKCQKNFRSVASLVKHELSCNGLPKGKGKRKSKIPKPLQKNNINETNNFTIAKSQSADEFSTSNSLEKMATLASTSTENINETPDHDTSLCEPEEGVAMSLPPSISNEKALVGLKTNSDGHYESLILPAMRTSPSV